MRVIVALLGLVQNEPGRLDGMAGTNHSAFKVIDELAVRSHGLQHGFEFGFHEITFDFHHAAVDPLLRQRIANGIAQYLSRNNHDHGNRQRLEAACFRTNLGFQQSGGGEILDHEAEQIIRFLRGFLLTRGFGISGERDHAECFGENVSPLAQRPALARDAVKHSTIVIESVAPDKINAVSGQLQPFFARFNRSIESGQQPDIAAMYPYRFVRRKHAAILI
ncbi:MAG: hypothetical protein ALAOOOJD_03895 [bacterium]|nr:hypothetical protein [bacterium]